LACRTLFARRLQRAPRAAVLAQLLPVLLDACVLGPAGTLPLAGEQPAVAVLGEGMENCTGVMIAAQGAALAGWRPEGDLNFERMRDVATRPEFAPQITGLAIDKGPLARLFTFAAEA
jgi:hypothetical protein